MKTGHILVVDDEPDIRELLAITLGRMDIDCEAAADIAQAEQLLESNSFDLCLTDMKLPDGNGLDLVAFVVRRYPHMPVAVITAHGNMETAIIALKSGAFDFVTKPVDLLDLRNLVSQALKLSGSPRSPSLALIGNSAAVGQLRETIAKLARSQAPVYIGGESGTGKELVARLIHEQGPRAMAAFVPVNCGAIPTNLMESEFRALKEVRRQAKPGVTLEELEAAFLGVIVEDGWKLGDTAWHFSLHGQGMDAIEWPYFSPMIEGNADAPLEEGMVFSYHPHRDTIPHVLRPPKIFDGFVITKNGGETLTTNWDFLWRIMK